MKGLFFVISFLFSTVLFCRADGGTALTSINKIEKKGLAESPRDYSQTTDTEALMVTSGTGRHSTSFFRYLSSSNVAEILAFVFSPKNHTDQAEFFKTYLYCEAIGQKLLYPKHYFW